MEVLKPVPRKSPVAPGEPVLTFRSDDGEEWSLEPEKAATLLGGAGVIIYVREISSVRVLNKVLEFARKQSSAEHDPHAGSYMNEWKRSFMQGEDLPSIRELLKAAWFLKMTDLEHLLFYTGTSIIKAAGTKNASTQT